MRDYRPYDKLTGKVHIAIRDHCPRSHDWTCPVLDRVCQRVYLRNKLQSIIGESTYSLTL